MKTPSSSSATWSSGSSASLPTREELLDGLDKLEGWPEKVRTMQRNWIGRSEGTEVDFFLKKPTIAGSRSGRVIEEQQDGFASSPRASTRSSARPACSWRREHPLVATFTAADPNLKAQVDELIEQQKKAREAGDLGAIEKHGVATGRFAINPYNGERVPIWVANYMLVDYGTGAIMSVPAHDERDFEFATKYGMPIRAGDSACRTNPGRESPAVYFRRRRAGELRRVSTG